MSEDSVGIKAQLLALSEGHDGLVRKARQI